MAPHDYSTTYDQGPATGGHVASSVDMTSARVPQPARGSRRTTPARGPVRRALVDALIEAVRDELEAVGASRTTCVVTKHRTSREISVGDRREMR